MRNVQRLVAAAPRSLTTTTSSSLTRLTTSGLARAPTITTVRALHTPAVLQKRVSINKSVTTGVTPTPSRSLARSSGAGEPRTLIDGGDGTVTVGPGYVTYSGPPPTGDAVALSSSSSIISYARLRDACPCPKCIHPSTRQKTHTSGEAFREVMELGNEVLDDRLMHRATTGDGEVGIEVHWPQPLEGKPHASFYPVSLLRRVASGRVRGHTYLNDTLTRKMWNRESLLKDAKNLWIDFAELNEAPAGEPFKMNPAVQLRLLEQLQLYGLAVVRGLPTDRTDNKDCRLREFAETIGGLRNTFYGETWDVKSVVNSKNVAYTNLNLGLHMDLLYFALPPRFQFLHSLRNRVVGGASYFVDSFAAAEKLKREAPHLYASLQANPLEYEYDNDDHYMTFQHPVLPPGSLSAHDVHTCINWSPPFQAPNVRPTKDANGRFPTTPQGRAGAEDVFYAALSAFQAALDSPEFRYEFTMQEGDIVLFDNQRVLHARTAFRDKTDEEVKDGTVIVQGEPTRWLKGCYLDGSTVWDKLAVLNDKVRGIPSV